MRRVRTAVVATLVAAALSGFWLAGAWRHPPTLVPAASIHLIGYTNFTTRNPSATLTVYPGPGTWLLARMVLTNEGRASISYAAWGFGEPCGWADARTAQGITNGYLAPRSSGGTAVLRPGCAATFSVILPTNTLQWQCGFEIEAASMRERAVSRIIGSRFRRKLPEVVFYPVSLLPDKAGPSVKVKSQSFDVSDAADSPHNLGNR